MKVRRLLVYMSGASALWSLAIRGSGGFLIQLGSVRISSRRYEPALIVAIACLTAAFAPVGRNSREAVRSEWEWWRQHVLRHVVAAGVRVSRLARAVSRWTIRGRPWWRYAPTAAALVVIGIAAAGALDRWAAPRSLWLDEETIAVNLRDRSFAALAGTLWFGQSAPYGWMAVERALIRLAGTSEQVLRLQPMLYFVATMIVAFETGRRWLNGLGTLVFVLCCACSAWMLHYAFEVKPYTADTCWALLIAVTTAWALEADEDVLRHRRVWVLWIVAAIGLWFANGALLSVPGCAAVLLVSTWRRNGWRTAWRAAGPGLIWLASLAVCYWLSLRFSLGSRYLYDYWQRAFPPADATFAARWAWLGQQLKPLAENPGSTTTGLLLWVVFVAGLLASRRPRLAALAATAPLTAFALGWLRIVPLHDRVAIWIAPHLYLGVALLADRGAAWAGDVWRRRRWRLLFASLAAAVASGSIVANLAEQRGRFLAPHEWDSPTHGEAAAVRWLMASRAPGDTVITTHMGWPAIWWYGGVAPGDGQPATPGHLPDGTPALELQPELQADCGDDLARIIARSGRTLIYVGFPDVPPSFLSDLRQVLEHSGKTIAIASFDPGRVWIVEPRAGSPDAAEGSPGCMPVWPALRW